MLNFGKFGMMNMQRLTACVVLMLSPVLTAAAYQSTKMPFIATYDPAKTAPSTMQDARGILALERGCVVLRQTGGSILLLWRRPAKIVGMKGNYRIEQMGRGAAIGAQVLLTGSGLGSMTNAAARRLVVPAACRPLSVFAVNGILFADPVR
jgi:hypothetical protein